MIEKNPFDYDAMSAMAENIIATFAEFDRRVAEAFEVNPILKAVLDYQEWQRQEVHLESLMHSNDRAADKRRKWRVKPSMVR